MYYIDIISGHFGPATEFMDVHNNPDEIDKSRLVASHWFTDNVRRLPKFDFFVYTCYTRGTLVWRGLEEGRLSTWATLWVILTEYIELYSKLIHALLASLLSVVWSDWACRKYRKFCIPNTVSPRNSGPFYIVSCCIKWFTTSWTYSK